MKALIFNSGIGHRLGKLTENNPKCMLKLYNGESIFERQIRLLSSCGIKEIIVTTGPFADQLYEVAKHFPEVKFEFVSNPDYKNTNYIVSMDEASVFLDDDILMLHGDLVFNRNLLIKLINDSHESACLFNETMALPEKDFKGRIVDGLLKEVSIDIFDDNCFAFQPLYKLSKETITLWKNKVREFVEGGIKTVYAENALNTITDSLKIYGISYKDDYIAEIDNEQDYKMVSNDIRFFDYREQIIDETGDFLDSLLKYVNADEKLFVVCGNNVRGQVGKRIEDSFSNVTYFSEFSPNPSFDQVKAGAKLFDDADCQKIISIGGGSAMDVAKGIKLYVTADSDEAFLNNKYNYNGIVHMAIPTTAGTGSESTAVAVIYNNGKKFSVDHQSILPQIAILDFTLLNSLPDYQKKTCFLDAMAQSIESFWSKASSEESRAYSKESITLLLKNADKYIAGDAGAYSDVLRAANLSGKAINLTRTTAPHAMSYKLTSMYGISHGHAVALGLIPCWKELEKNSYDDQAIKERLSSLAKIFGTDSILDSISVVEKLIKKMDLPKINIADEDLEILASSVNPERLQNNPVVFSKEILFNIYRDIKGENDNE